ncbi:hypothetical protein HK101_010328, partial [Irineochytrium annulatum]
MRMNHFGHGHQNHGHGHGHHNDVQNQGFGQQQGYGHAQNQMPHYVNHPQQPTSPQQQFGTNSQMRTVYLGSIPNGVTYEDIMNHVRTGVVEMVKILEEKNCAFITFLDPAAAVAFFTECQAKRISIGGLEAKLGWGKPSVCNPMILAAVQSGATRNVFIGTLDDAMMSEGFLFQELSKFGPVDQIKIVPDKRIAFVHMTSIAAAVNAVTTLASDPRFQGRRVHYGKDRSAYHQQQHNHGMGMNGHGGHGHGGPGMNGMNGLMGGHFVGQQGQQGGFDGNGLNSQNRTVYLGGVHPEATTKDICDVIRGGMLQNVKFMPDKNIAFVTFIEPSAALALYNRGNFEGVVIKGKRVKVGWGKPSPLPINVANVIQTGASRNVYIGNIDEQITEDRLRSDFSDFGEVELVNLIADKNIGFVNFADVVSAVRAVEAIKANPEYAAYKIAYGKD